MRAMIPPMLLLAACAFDPSANRAAGASDGGVSDGGGGDDASFFDDGGVCVPGTKACMGRSLETCNSAGDGIDDQASMLCDFTCDSLQCAQTSNLPDTEIGTCDDQSPILAPPDAATVAIRSGGSGLEISCDPHCGDVGTSTIANSGSTDMGGGLSITHFCLSAVNIPGDVTVTIEPSASSIALFVDGAVLVDGKISAIGENANSSTPGVGGPGGGQGGASGGDSGGLGLPGEGSCGGVGGASAGSPSNFAASGGGGGASGSDGGKGGNGISPQGDSTAVGGDGGLACTTAELLPLIGGSGGAAGADGTCGGDCSWPGGGGGGAFQMTSRSTITFNGGFAASGGIGFGTDDPGGGGGGGGGAGGALLLEAPVVNLGGTAELSALGGSGGLSGGGAGGTTGMNGTTSTSNGDGGGGGGGGAGVVRINARTQNGCAQVLAPTTCSTGPLRTAAPE